MAYYPIVIAKNIRRFRKEAGLTQEKLAKQLDMSVLHYGRLERGERRVSLEQLVLLADELKVTVYDLLEGSLDGAPVKSQTACEEIALLAARCSEEGQQLLRDICAVIAKKYDI